MDRYRENPKNLCICDVGILQSEVGDDEAHDVGDNQTDHAGLYKYKKAIGEGKSKAEARAISQQKGSK